MGLEIRNVTEDRFEMTDRPSRAPMVVVLVLFALSSTTVICVSGQVGGFILVIMGIGFLVMLFESRWAEQRTVIDRSKGMIGSQRMGLFGGPVGAATLDFPVSEVENIEIKRHRLLFGDSYEVRARLRSGRQVPLTGPYREAQDGLTLAGQISAFLDLSGVPKIVE